MRRLRKLLGLPSNHIVSLVTASLLLALARWKHAHQPIAKLIDEIRTPINANLRTNTALVTRIAWALQTAAAMVPWRADCLVRAIAARHWAERAGLPFTFHIGVTLGPTGELEAHAWSQSGTMFLTGDIPELARFSEFDLEQLPASQLRFSE
jgi:hypothetical protein